MSNLTLTITESENQITAGIPESVIIETNISATIFYTLDGSVPTTFSNIYVFPIKFSTEQLSYILKVFASNGIETTDIIEKQYGPTLVGLVRPYSEIIPSDCNNNQFSNFPFGGRNISFPVTFGNTAKSIKVVDDPKIAGYPDGYDGSGTNTIAVETDLPLTAYQIKFSETDSQGKKGHGIGTLPAKFKLRMEKKNQPPLQSNTYDRIFDPRALVMYQDSSKENDGYPNPKIINRALFSFDKSVAQENYLQTAHEGKGPTGKLLVPIVNYQNNTILYSYFDSYNNRWIFSKEKFTNKNPEAGAMYRVVYPREGSSRYILKHYPGIYHKNY